MTVTPKIVNDLDSKKHMFSRTIFLFGVWLPLLFRARSFTIFAPFLLWSRCVFLFFRLTYRTNQAKDRCSFWLWNSMFSTGQTVQEIQSMSVAEAGGVCKYAPGHWCAPKAGCFSGSDVSALVCLAEPLLVWSLIAAPVSGQVLHSIPAGIQVHVFVFSGRLTEQTRRRIGVLSGCETPCFQQGKLSRRFNPCLLPRLGECVNMHQGIGVPPKLDVFRDQMSQLGPMRTMTRFQPHSPGFWKKTLIPQTWRLPLKRFQRPLQLPATFCWCHDRNFHQLPGSRWPQLLSTCHCHLPKLQAHSLNCE